MCVQPYTTSCDRIQPSLVPRPLPPPTEDSWDIHVQPCINETKTVFQEPGNEADEILGMRLGMRLMKAWE